VADDVTLEYLGSVHVQKGVIDLHFMVYMLLNFTQCKHYFSNFTKLTNTNIFVGV
jgi:hypothetical protein